MELLLKLPFSLIGNIIFVWVILEALEKLNDVKVPKEKRRKLFWSLVIIFTATSTFLNF